MSCWYGMGSSMRASKVHTVRCGGVEVVSCLSSFSSIADDANNVKKGYSWIWNRRRSFIEAARLLLHGVNEKSSSVDFMLRVNQLRHRRSGPDSNYALSRLWLELDLIESRSNLCQRLYKRGANSFRGTFLGLVGRFHGSNVDVMIFAYSTSTGICILPLR
jgi:hypothetical protein